MPVEPRPDPSAAARAIEAFLKALGHDPAHDPELTGTPERVARAFLDDFLCGYQVDVPGVLAGGSAVGADDSSAGLVLLEGLDVATVCPHHLTLGLGAASVAYDPGRRLLGLGALAETVRAFSRRLALQEAIGEAVTDALMRHAGARGAWCRLQLTHGCLCGRTDGAASARVVTVASRGSLRAGPRAQELATLLAG